MAGLEELARIGIELSRRRTFFGYEWVDDHIMIEADRADRLRLADATSRHVTMAILGPRSINEAKFLAWTHELSALGLIWNTRQRTVSMPQDKIEKARRRAQAMEKAGSATKKEMEKLIGSLRHIAICLRTTKPFFQQLQCWCNRVPRFERSQLPPSVKNDIRWFMHILEHGRLQALPLSMFGALPQADLHLYMDASNSGLAVLNPAWNEFIQIQFDDDERQAMDENSDSRSAFSINVREHFCMALAAWVWGPRWAATASSDMTHIQCWSDNAAAVCWNNLLYSPNHRAQEINRAIGLAEAVYSIRLTASHLPGTTNMMVDAASRAWTEPHMSTWANFSLAWSQVQIPVHLRKIYKTFSSCYSPSRWPRPLTPNIPRRGSSGSIGVPQWASTAGSVPAGPSIRTSSRYLPSSRLSTDGDASAAATKQQLSSPRSATSRGIISASSATLSTSVKGTGSPSKECANSEQVLSVEPQSQCPFSDGYTLASTSTCHMTAPCGEATIMGFFFLLRRSEFLAMGTKHHQYAIRRSDISFEYSVERQSRALRTASRVTIQFRGSKNDQGGEGVTLMLTRSGSRWCCPVKALQFLVSHHISTGTDPNDLLCKVSRSSSLQARSLANVLKTAGRNTGENEAVYDLHPLRSGGATAMFESGVDNLTIKQFGRWKSDAYERYTRLSARATENLASAMIGQAQR